MNKVYYCIVQLTCTHMCIHIHTYPHTVYHGIELPTTGNRMYVDPTTYSHVDRAVEDFAKEIGPKSIRLTEEIGNGEFGNVYRGIWRTDSKDQLPIAVKTLKVRVSLSIPCDLSL